MKTARVTKWFSSLMCVSLLLMLTSPAAFAQQSPLNPIDEHTFVLATSGGIDTLDPALAYDTASGEVIQNVYETLVFYDGANASAFVPQLADSYNLSPDGLTWTFHIRPGVTFHNGASLTPSDVAYSFQRGLLQGGTSSPQWLLTEAFFGIGIDDVSLLVDPGGSLYDDRAALSAWNPAQLVAACNQVKSAVVANDVAGTVTLHLAQPWGPFLGTIAGTWGSIMDKDWTIAQGSWDGFCNTWQNWYAMASADDPLSGIANGTGPFKLDIFNNGVEVALARNNSYWRAPAQLARVEILNVPDDATRFAMLQTFNADQIAMPGGNRAQADGMVGEDCIWNITTAQYDCSVVDQTKPLRRYIGRPGITQDEVLLNFNIAASGNPYIGSGLLDGNGIPFDFFSDAHIRKAFNYCFNWDAYSQNAFGGEFVQAFTLPIEGMPGYDRNAPHYTFNLTKCQEEFGLADVDHDGIPSVTDTNDVTQVGFHFQIVYNEGNASRQVVAEILSANLSQIDPKFVGEAVSLPWPDYLAALRALQIPIMTGGWWEDIHDPHNWYQPYLVGTYAGRAGIPTTLKAQFQVLINQGVAATGFAARHAIYQQLNQLVYDNTPFIMLGGVTSHTFIQRTVNGRVLNPIFNGNYYYTIYKSTFADVSDTYWASTFIERLYNAGVTGGCSITPPMYCPDTVVTRAQMAVFLEKGLHGSSYSPPAATGMVFTDVSSSYWAAAWIEKLAADGITGGCGSGNYCPDATVTRAQMAVFLLKAEHGISYSPPAATGVFTDVPVGYWADKWIEQLAVESITGGCGGGNYCPDSSVTRAQMAVFLVKTFNLP